MSLERFPNKVFRTLVMSESTEEQRKAPCWHSAAKSSYSISYTTNSKEPDKSACDIICVYNICTHHIRTQIYTFKSSTKHSADPDTS